MTSWTCSIVNGDTKWGYECIHGVLNRVIYQRYDCTNEQGEPMVVWQVISSLNLNLPCP